ncbi:MAG: FecCD family ABC transporter permease [Roseburia sp.]
MTEKRKNSWITIFMIAGLILSLLLVCAIGATDVTLGHVIKIIWCKLSNTNMDTINQSELYIVWNLRLPRALAAAVIGGGLAVAGTAMQSVTRNVMADPFVLGISSGALAFVSIGSYIGATAIMIGWQTSLLAFLGALFAVGFVFAISGMRGTISGGKLILTGQAISITLNAVAQYFIYTSTTSNKSSSIVTWMMGSLAGIRWDNLWIPLIGILICVCIFISYARAFDLMALGDETAISLGIHISRMKRITLILVAFITGFAVAASGIIGLVGFMIPHIVRFIVGTSHKKLFPLTFLSGGIFLLWMDVFARTLLEPQEVPIGIFTALCGGPFFVWMIHKRMKAN